MFDIKRIREDIDSVYRGLSVKNHSADLESILSMDQRRRELLVEADDLRSRKNAANQEISTAISKKEDPRGLIDSMKEIAARVDAIEPEIRELTTKLQSALLSIPNLPHSSVPAGGEEANEVVRSWGEKSEFSFSPRDHIDLAERLDIIDFKRATKLSGSHFILFKGAGARLERALLNFMLDLHTSEHGYTEVMPPVLVNRESMTGTGQLPKMEDDMYRLDPEDLFLIPTAEVPVTNIHRGEILDADALPICYTAYTPCFRREAGSYGKDTKGLMRVHQFDKVELVKFVHPDSSYDELEGLLGNAEKVFQLLNLPYRILRLAGGDLSFAAAKCYDIEAYAPGLDRWLEVSSCSNFEDFQARRANIRFKDPSTRKTRWVHTLNGSGVALARTVIALLENYQTDTGDVLIPDVLRPYMGGVEKITAPAG